MSPMDVDALLREEPLLALLGVVPGQAFRADLHAHTVLSDGADTFEELLGKSRVHGVTHQAVTNHDTTRGLNGALAFGRAHGFTVVPGVEISAQDPNTGRRVHVLGLGVSEGAPAIEALAAPTLAKRTANTCRQLERLLEAGFDVDVDEAARLAARSTAFYKQHLITALVHAPFTSEAYQSKARDVFKNGGICDHDIAYVDMRDAVRAICEDGGLAVLAHPLQFDSLGAVPQLVDAGLAGIEVFHHTADAAGERACAQAAAQHGLFVTGGSDYHGSFGKPPHPGYRYVDERIDR